MALNAEDGGNRQCILVTNNENNIAEEVCYERNKRLIQGYANSKGQWVEGLGNNNLRYFKTDFVSREANLVNKKALTHMATEMLCIKEDCYDAYHENLSETDWMKIFTNKKGLFFIVIYDDLMIEESVRLLKELQANESPAGLIKVYVFSNGQYPYTEDFEEVLPYVELCALPDAIYKAYQHILPDPGKARVIETEDEIQSEELELPFA